MGGGEGSGAELEVSERISDRLSKDKGGLAGREIGELMQSGVGIKSNQIESNWLAFFITPRPSHSRHPQRSWRCIQLFLFGAFPPSDVRHHS